MINNKNKLLKNNKLCARLNVYTYNLIKGNARPAIRNHRGWYKLETKIHPRPVSNYTAAASTAEQKGTAF